MFNLLHWTGLLCLITWNWLYLLYFGYQNTSEKRFTLHALTITCSLFLHSTVQTSLIVGWLIVMFNEVGWTLLNYLLPICWRMGKSGITQLRQCKYNPLHWTGCVLFLCTVYFLFLSKQILWRVVEVRDWRLLDRNWLERNGTSSDNQLNGCKTFANIRR